MFTKVQHNQLCTDYGRNVLWQAGDATGQLYTLTGTQLGAEITRVLFTRGWEPSHRRYPTGDDGHGSLPYLSWMVAQGDEHWSLAAGAHKSLEALLSGFEASPTALRLTRPLHPQEHIYGLGERTAHMAKEGQAFPIWNVDPPMHHDEHTSTMYVSIPFYISLNVSTGEAHGVFLDHTGRVDVDLGVAQRDQLSLTIEGDTLAVYFLAGPTPADVLRQYSELTGRMPLPPRWALGYHQSRWGYESAAEVCELAQKLRERQHPCDALWLDIDYMDGFRNFTWNPQTFADPRELVETLQAQGIHLVTILDPGTKYENEYAVYQQGDEQDYFCRYPDGSYFLGEVWPGTCVFPDFSRQDVREWWGSLYREHVELGVAGIWNDMNEPALTSILSQNSAEHVHGRTMDSNVLHRPEVLAGKVLEHRFFHNAYGQQMARATYEGLRKLQPDGRPFVLSRAGTGGIQRYAAIWTGDNTSTWEHLSMAMPMCLNLSMSGVPFIGVDLGGFWTDSNGELAVRFAQLGAFLPFCRNHNAKYVLPQEPWAFGEPFEQAYRQAIELRYRSLPYLYTLFAEASRTGAPIMRPLYYHYAQDAQAIAIENEFLVGEHLLSAPIEQSGAHSRSVYLPAGTAWFDYWSNALYAGGDIYTIDASLEHWPLFVRANSILPLGPVMQYTAEMATDPLSIHCYLTSGGQAGYTLYEDDGLSQAYTQGGYAETHITCQHSGTVVHVEITEQWTGYQPVRSWYEVILHLADRPPLIRRVQAGAGKASFTFPLYNSLQG